jgi:tRNA (mo5U34)-methyltransferase
MSAGWTSPCFPELAGDVTAPAPWAGDPAVQAWRQWVTRDGAPLPALGLEPTGGVTVGQGSLAADGRTCLQGLLEALGPWRKGPWSVAGLALDAEWRCEQKWARMAPLVGDLARLTVADIGAGNAWYGLRACLDGAARVLCADPSLPMLRQAAALLDLVPPETPLRLVHAGVEEAPRWPPLFDQVWLWGVLYHHPDPVHLLRAAARPLAPGGRLIVETIVVEGPAGWVLLPQGRYAGARGFWYLPTVTALLEWVRRAGLRVVDRTEPHATGPAEQRSTAWRPGASLPEGLVQGPDGPRTVEGYPPPLRMGLALVPV